MQKHVKSSKAVASIYSRIREILETARSSAYRAVNFAMVQAYWHIGSVIVEEEQQGKKKADYGTKLINELSLKLSKDFGSGFSAQSLWNMRQFYLYFPILSAVRRELSWTHYKILLRVDKQNARDFYLEECAKSNWSTRQLERQVYSFYYERLLASKNRLPVKREADKRAKQLKSAPEEQIKDPYVLEFLGLQEMPHLRESQIEQALVDHLQKFLLELGRGFSFVARQMRISTETQHFYVDLVFYNYLLKCFVIIDLKTGKLTHQDIGQMDMYFRIFEDKMKQPGDNPTIGIILCTEKDETIVKYSILKGNKKLFASKYKLYLPTEKELKEELEREKRMLGMELKLLKSKGKK
ncbi:MAG: cytoplasmic protein [Nitrospirae bacterium]|nr:MAG: cytoplasmic protein [Nitrospirota bacterium]